MLLRQAGRLVTAGGVFDQLGSVDFGIDRAVFQQLGVSAAGDQPAFIEHEDQIGIAHRADTLGNHEASAPAHKPIEGALDQCLSRDIHIASAVVEDEQARIEQQGAGDGDALFLAAR